MRSNSFVMVTQSTGIDKHESLCKEFIIRGILIKLLNYDWKKIKVLVFDEMIKPTYELFGHKSSADWCTYLTLHNGLIDHNVCQKITNF